MGCILALSKTHMAASTIRSRCNFFLLSTITRQLVQVQSTSRGCHPEKPSIMKGQPGNHTVLVGTNLTLPCELMVSECDKIKIKIKITTRLTYNCAHLRSTKESLTDSVKKNVWRKFFCVKIFLGENLLGEHFLSEHFFLVSFFG